MSNLNTREEKLSILFATHPKTDKFYLASDDRAFFDQHNADGYAQGLKDKDVKVYTRSLHEKIVEIKAKIGAELGVKPGDLIPGLEETRDALRVSVTEHFADFKKEPLATSETIERTGATETTDETEETTSEENTAPAADADGKTEEGGDKAGADESGAAESGDDRAAVVAKYEEVIGKKPNNFMKLETMQAKIAEALAAK